MINVDTYKAGAARVLQNSRNVIAKEPLATAAISNHLIIAVRDCFASLAMTLKAVRGVFHLGLLSILVGAHRDAPLQGGSRTAPTGERREGGALRRVRGFFMGARQAAPLLLVMFLATPAFSATINVTANATDTLATNSSCSLREAITNINNSSTTYADCAPTGSYGTSDTINIPAGTYTTAISGTGEDSNATGDYDIKKSVTITGAGLSTTTINGGSLDRVFHITGSYTVSISDVTITGGNTTSSGGGGINNSGTLTITNSTISGNTATTNGGGINNGFSSATLTITNSTISDNYVGPNNYSGGGIDNSGTLTITNSTISGNSAVYAGGGIATGNGDPTTKSTITNSTISGNASRYGGGVRIASGTATLSNTIVANQTSGSDCSRYSGTFTSSGHNLESSTSCGFTGTGDKQNKDPLLGALADNGGPTQTMALQSGSPAIDAGSCVNSTDQRGYGRPSGATCDIGAYEYDGGTTATTAPTATTGTATNITETSATLNGTVNPNNASTTVKFQYGTTTSYGTNSSKVTLTGSTAQTASVDVTGLTCDTTYHFKVKASNSEGTTKGSDVTFATSACTTPIATTDPATNKTKTGATLNGTVNPNGLSTTVRFRYGTTSAYGSRTTSQTLTGATDQAVSDTLTGLTCGTKYYFMVRASNSSGVTKGSARTFKTSACADAP